MRIGKSTWPESSAISQALEGGRGLKIRESLAQLCLIAEVQVPAFVVSIAP
jgi:hypothetical protein